MLKVLRNPHRKKKETTRANKLFQQGCSIYKYRETHAFLYTSYENEITKTFPFIIVQQHEKYKILYRWVNFIP